MVESSHVYAVSNASHRGDRIQIRLMGGSIVLAPNAHCFSLTTRYLNSKMCLENKLRIELEARPGVEEDVSFVIDYC